MNERIKGLWWKARIGYNEQNCEPEVLEKFAELIVRECARVDSEANNVDHVDGETYNQTILQHFGIKK